MASVLGDTRCSIHPDRQGSARCPICRQSYCAECITEHEGKLTCASCLRTMHETEAKPKERRSFVIAPFIQIVIALALCWVAYYLFAQTLADVPDDFHDGTIWE